MEIKPQARGPLANHNDILTDQADWDAETWDMEPAGLEVLDRVLTGFYERSLVGIKTGARWAGDKYEHTETDSIEELSRIIRDSALGTRIMYEVNKQR